MHLNLIIFYLSSSIPLEPQLQQFFDPEEPAFPPPSHCPVITFLQQPALHGPPLHQPPPASPPAHAQCSMASPNILAPIKPNKKTFSQFNQPQILTWLLEISRNPMTVLYSTHTPTVPDIDFTPVHEEKLQTRIRTLEIGSSCSLDQIYLPLSSIRKSW